MGLSKRIGVFVHEEFNFVLHTGMGDLSEMFEIASIAYIGGKNQGVDEGLSGMFPGKSRV